MSYFDEILAIRSCFTLSLFFKYPEIKNELSPLMLMTILNRNMELFEKYEYDNIIYCFNELMQEMSVEMAPVALGYA